MKHYFLILFFSILINGCKKNEELIINQDLITDKWWYSSEEEKKDYFFNSNGDFEQANYFGFGSWRWVDENIILVDPFYDYLDPSCCIYFKFSEIEEHSVLIQISRDSEYEPSVLYNDVDE